MVVFFSMGRISKQAFYNIRRMEVLQTAIEEPIR